jgi:hypothetical protein
LASAASSAADRSVRGAGFRLWLFGLARPVTPRGGPFGSISRGAIYRVESPIRRVHMAEFSRAWAAMYRHARTIKLAIKKITAMGQR